MSDRPPKSAAERAARVLQLDRGRLRTTLLVACVLAGRPTWTSLAVGAAVVLPGAALHLWTKGCLRIGDEVTTSGPYRWTRNPFYVATLIVDVGLCVAAWNPWIAAAYLPVFWFVHRLTIRREERALSEIFGARYAAYAARVPRFFPWKGPASELPPSTGFSWSNHQLVVGGEYARIVRTMMAPLIVAVGADLATDGPGLATPWQESPLVWTLAALFVAERLLVLRSRRRKAALRAEARQPSSANGGILPDVRSPHSRSP
jgi:hypothetical protein